MLQRWKHDLLLLFRVRTHALLLQPARHSSRIRVAAGPLRGRQMWLLLHREQDPCAPVPQTVGCHIPRAWVRHSLHGSRYCLIIELVLIKQLLLFLRILLVALQVIVGNGLAFDAYLVLLLLLDFPHLATVLLANLPFEFLTERLPRFLVLHLCPTNVSSQSGHPPSSDRGPAISALGYQVAFCVISRQVANVKTHTTNSVVCLHSAVDLVKILVLLGLSRVVDIINVVAHFSILLLCYVHQPILIPHLLVAIW